MPRAAKQIHSNKITGEVFNRKPYNLRSPDTGTDSYTVSGDAQLAIGYYKGKLLTFGVEVSSTTVTTLSKYRPKAAGAGMVHLFFDGREYVTKVKQQIPYQLWQEVTRNVSTRYRYFWQEEGRAKEYLIDADVTYEGTTFSRYEVDSLTNIQTGNEWHERYAGRRVHKKAFYVAREYGDSIKVISADPTRKMACFYLWKVKEPVQSTYVLPWEYLITGVRRQWGVTGWFPTLAAAVADARRVYGWDYPEDPPVFPETPLPTPAYCLPESTLYLHIYFPNGRIYKEKIRTAAAISSDERSDLEEWEGEYYGDLAVPGFPEMAQGGEYAPVHTGGAVAMQPELIGSEYAVVGKYMDLSCGLSGLMVPSSLKPNYPTPTKAETQEELDALIADAAYQEEHDWPGGGYMKDPDFGGMHTGYCLAMQVKAQA